MLATLLLATCVSTNLQCGARVNASGCTRFTFEGQSDSVIGATMRPLDISLSNPRLTLEVPVPGFHPPIVNGGQTATLRYILPAYGMYVVQAETDSPGRYLFALDCRPITTPGIPRDCVRQDLGGGERVQWELTNDACRDPDPAHLASAFFFYGVAGDPVTFTLKSSFPPHLDFYGANIYPIRRVDGEVTTFVPPVSGPYYVEPSSTQTGTYELTMSARLSGCVRPLIVRQPDDVAVPYGSRATLRGGDISASGGGLLFEWLDMQALPVIVSNSEQLTTPPVTLPQYYALRATNACGSVTTRMIVVSPAVNHRRPTR
jgi:hypothetical protein